MIQTNLFRYERSRTGAHDPAAPTQNVHSEESESGTEVESTELDPDEVAILDYVQQNEHVSKEELCHLSGLPQNHLDEILEELSNAGMIDISPGYSIVQIKSRLPYGGTSK